MPIKEKIAEIVQPIVESFNAFIVDIEVRTIQGRKMVEIFVDNDEGVTTELCSEISREVSHVLDDAEIFRDRYYLVVSSPGVERPLKYFRQYKKNIGRLLSVKIKKDEKIELLKGNLICADVEEIIIRLEGGTDQKIPFNSIIKAQIEAVI